MIKRLFLIASILLLSANAFSQNFDGLWRSRGYGWLLAIESNEYLVYQETAVSLIPWFPGTIVGDQFIAGEIRLGTLSQSGDTLIFTRVDDNVIKFDPIDTLPEITQATADPEINFEIFWHSFEENCALLTLTGVDWRAMYNQYRPQVTAATTEQELFDIFVQMVTPLNDRHTSVVAVINGQQTFFNTGPVPASWWILLPGYRSLFSSIHTTNYLDNGALNKAANDLFEYGTINQSIGYLNILSYEGYSGSETAIPNLELEAAIFTENLDTVLAEFQNMDALIIDIRWNGGGNDFLGLKLADRLTVQRRLGHSKQARFGGYDEFTELHHRYFAPEGVQFLNKPVVLLTSGNTMSAADIQTMILKNLPNVTLIGETTYGIFSSTFEHFLPNGWFFTLTNERVLSYEGIDYE
ncbi:MAG: S41 family peptidase, partial [bacterium]